MLLWFRNDLRIRDNPALTYALNNGVTDAIFFISPKQWAKHQLAAIKIDFIIRHAQLLKQQLASLGITLHLIEAADFNDQQAYLLFNKVTQLITNAELELNELQRDQKLKTAGIAFIECEADVIVPKGQVLNQSGQMFRVFTPFKRAWLSWLRQHGLTMAQHHAIDDYLMRITAQNLPLIAANLVQVPINGRLPTLLNRY